jgi:hypothetical protein
VRFAPNSDRESGHPLQAMSALPWKADVCSATSNVGYGPIADIGSDKEKAATTAANQLRFLFFNAHVGPSPSSGDAAGGARPGP